MNASLFSLVDPEARIPARHRLGKIRQLADDAQASLDAGFEALCTDFGRPSIAPDRLIRASPIHFPFSVRSEREVMAIPAHRDLAPPLSDDHFWVDGTLA